jgi:hypothetical protein
VLLNPQNENEEKLHDTKDNKPPITHKFKGLLLDNRGSNTKELECHANLQSKKYPHVSTNFLPLNEKTPTKNLS